MPGLPLSNPEQFIQGSPVLHVPDVIALATYFRDVLGFHWDFGDAHYAVVWRDNSAVHRVQGTEYPTGVHLFQWLRDVDAYRAELLARGVAASEPKDTPYGLREFTVRVPGDIRMVFGQDKD